ncbi:MAG TPA: phytoene/squalene synthase family protein [Polyangiaceae bacterium]
MKANLEQDWAYCEQALVDVSRTFSKPIELLPEPLRVALTTAYLLCRVVDTVEDYAPLGSSERDELFTRFIAVLDGQASPESFSLAFANVPVEDAEIRLARSLARVMRVFDGQDTATRRATVIWLSEMANGMRLYCRRDRPGTLSTLFTFSDLERYCYFVAGTVGHLITDLFCEFMEAGSSPLEPELRARAESFGIGLQMVNILKDVTDDFARQRCYVPRQSCRAEGFAPERLLAPEHRQKAHRAIAPMFEAAARHLDDALEYTLLIPPQYVQLRLFCLLPLYMAQQTLIVAVGNDAMLKPDQPVKISRDAVDEVIQDCLRHANDDGVLRRRYAGYAAQFRERLASLQPGSRPFAAPAGRHARA